MLPKLRTSDSLVFVSVCVCSLHSLFRVFFFFSSRRRHTRCSRDWSSDVCSSDLELFSPPYLFKGVRPTITGALPARVGYGQTLQVDTPDGAGIAKVTLIRLSSVTHAFDESARLVPLTFAPATGGLSIALPASRAVAPPGPYM